MTLMILPVWIHRKSDPDRRVKVYTVLDDQSDTCFVTDDVMTNLGLTGTAIKLELGTMHAIEKIDRQRIDGLVVSCFDGEVDIPLPKVYSRRHIPGLRRQIPHLETARKYGHLKKIADEIPPYEEHLSIGLLIGNNCVRALKPRYIVPGKSNNPYAVCTTLVWGVIGARSHGEHEDDAGETAECHRIATREILSQEESTSKFIPLKSCKEIMIPSTIKRMFEQDFSENQETNSAMSQEDLKFMKITAGGIYKADKGHYQVPLLLHDENFMADVQYPVGQGAQAQAALPVAQGIQPADKLAAHGAQAVGGQVAQVVQQFAGQVALPAAEHVAQKIQPAAAQVPQQAVGQAQHGELEVEYVHFCPLCVFLINCEQGQGQQPFICLSFLPVFGFPAHSLLMF